MRHGKIIHTMEMLQSSVLSPGEAPVQYLPAQHCFHPPTNPAVSLFIYLTVHLSIHLPSSAVIQLCLCICSPIHLSVRPGIHHSSIHPSSVCCPFVCPVISPYLHRFPMHLHPPILPTQPTTHPSHKLAESLLCHQPQAGPWDEGMPETQSLSSKCCSLSLRGPGRSLPPVLAAARTLCVGVGPCWSRCLVGALPTPHMPPHLVSFLLCCPVCLLPSRLLLAPALLLPGCLGAPAFSRPD